MIHDSTQPISIFNLENPQNFKPPCSPRSGLDFIALIKWLLMAQKFVAASESAHLIYYPDEYDEIFTLLPRIGM